MTFPLLETIMGFAVIMLTLSYLVKSLTSVVKNHIDYYSKNLRGELDRFLVGVLGKASENLPVRGPGGKEDFPMRRIQWKRLSEEFLSEENIVWWLGQLGMTPQQIEDRKDALAARLAVHRANLQYAFSRRNANIALGMGLALCLFLNINAFTLWETLYRDQEVRAKFASSESVQAALQLAEMKKEEALPEAAKPAVGEAAAAETPKNKEAEREKLAAEREELLRQIAHLGGEVSFGVGRVWTEDPPQDHPWRFLGFEFLGSLLTGVLVSIGAPYWHDLLRSLARLRGGKQPAAGGG